MAGLLRELPVGSRFKSALLLPLGIAAEEVGEIRDREYVLARLEELERRLGLGFLGGLGRGLLCVGRWMGRGTEELVRRGRVMGCCLVEKS